MVQSVLVNTHVTSECMRPQTMNTKYIIYLVVWTFYLVGSTVILVIFIFIYVSYHTTITKVFNRKDRKRIAKVARVFFATLA